MIVVYPIFLYSCVRGMSIRNDFFDKTPMQKQELLRKMSYEELHKIRYLDLSTKLLWHALHPEETEHFARLHGRARDMVEKMRRDDPNLLGIVYGKGSNYLGEVQRIMKEPEALQYQFRAYIWYLPVYHKKVFAHLRKRLTGEEINRRRAMGKRQGKDIFTRLVRWNGKADGFLRTSKTYRWV